MRSDPFDLVGDVLDGQFRVDAFVGEGDLSVVYRGHHVGVDAPVAIKCLNLPESLDAALSYPLVLGFQESSRVHYRLARGNLNIAQTIASGMTVAPRTGVVVSYLVREWFEGESLASDLARRRSEGHKGRPLGETLALLESAFDAIAYAHAQGEAHLSVNPRNLFLARPESAGPSRSMKVLDFGFAHSVGRFVPEGAESDRGGGLHLLLPAYAAPEQLERTAGKPGPWTDVYALALVVLEVLSDRMVMGGSETPAVLDRVLDRRRRPTPRGHGLVLPPHVDAALARAVSRSPDARQKSAGELWADLKRPAPAIPRPVLAAAAKPEMAESPELPQPPAPLRPPELPEPAELPRPKGATSVESLSLSFEQDVAAPLAVEPAEKTEVRSEPASLAERASAAPSSLDRWLVAGSARWARTWSAARVWAEGLHARMPRLGVAIARMPRLGAAIARMPRLGAAIARSSVRFAALRSASPDLLVTRVKGAAFVGAIGGVGLVLLVLSSRRPAQHAALAGVASAMVALRPAAPPSRTREEPPAAVVEPQPQPPRGPFDRGAAVRALDGVWRRVAKCRRDKAWGKASTTVRFAADGSIAEVTVDAPFAGTPTGQCIADTLAGVRVEPFADGPASLVYRVYVAP